MILHIALKDLKIVFKDKKALAIILVMPAVIMLILGSALGPMFEGTTAIKRFAVVVVNKDEGMLSQIYIQDMLRGYTSDMLNTFVEPNEDVANKMLKDKKVSSVVIIPERFTDKFLEGNAVSIEVKSQVDQKLKGDIVKSITEGFTQQLYISRAAASSAVDALKELNIPIEKPVESMSDLQAVMNDMQQKMGEESIEFTKDEQQKNQTVSGMQYYSAAMLVMFILFGATMGTKLMVEERETRTMSRLTCTSVSKTALITGKFLGLLFITFTQAVILIVFTRFVYGVDWGRSIPGILIITVCAAFSGSGLGMMIGAIAKTSKASEGIAQMFIQVFTVVGGGMVPLYVMPDIVKTLAKGTLNWWAVNGYYDLMLGKDMVSVLPYCLVLVLMGMVYLSIGSLRFKT